MSGNFIKKEFIPPFFKNIIKLDLKMHIKILYIEIIIENL